MSELTEILSQPLLPILAKSGTGWAAIAGFAAPLLGRALFPARHAKLTLSLFGLYVAAGLALPYAGHALHFAADNLGLSKAALPSQFPMLANLYFDLPALYFSSLLSFVIVNAGNRVATAAIGFLIGVAFTAAWYLVGIVLAGCYLISQCP